MSKKVLDFMERVSELLEDKGSGVKGRVDSEEKFAEVLNYSDAYAVHPDDILDTHLTVDGGGYMSGKEITIEVAPRRADGSLAYYFWIFTTTTAATNKIMEILVDL